MSSVGFDRRTGKILRDWDHVKQSVETILTTARYTRVMRRHFGADLSSLIDSPMNDRVVIAAFVAIAEALEPRMVEGRQYGEPRYRVSGIQVQRADATGQIEFLISGTYYPRGHLGDFRVSDERTLTIGFDT